MIRAIRYRSSLSRLIMSAGQSRSPPDEALAWMGKIFERCVNPDDDP